MTRHNTCAAILKMPICKFFSDCFGGLPRMFLSVISMETINTDSGVLHTGEEGCHIGQLVGKGNIYDCWVDAGHELVESQAIMIQGYGYNSLKDRKDIVAYQTTLTDRRITISEFVDNDADPVTAQTMKLCSKLDKHRVRGFVNQKSFVEMIYLSLADNY